jgi:hypothetical protein
MVGEAEERGLGGLKYLQCGSHGGSWDGGGIIKEDGCGRREYEGEDVDD